jgi:hypothetical protein
MGPPRRVRRPGGGAGRVRGRGSGGRLRRLTAPPAPPVLVANVRRRRGRPGLVARLGDWPGRIVATALVDARHNGSGGYARGVADQFRSASQPRRGAPRPDHGVRARDDDPRDRGPRPARRTGSRSRLPTAGRLMRPTPWAWPAPPALGVDAGMIARASPGSGVGRRLERKGGPGRRGVTDHGHHPTAIRETLAAVRQRPGRGGVLGRCEPHLPPDGAAGRLRRERSAADAVAIADIWPARSRHVDHSAAGLPRPHRGPKPRFPSGPGSVRRPPPGSRAKSDPATPCW